MVSPLEWFSVILVVAGAGGLLFSLLHLWNRTKFLERERREELWASLASAKQLLGDPALIEKFAATHGDQELSRTLWLNYQGATDLYTGLVEKYLAQEPSFTYADLERLCSLGFINKQWQEERWRFLLCRRPENATTAAPSQFVTAEQANVSAATHRPARTIPAQEARNGETVPLEV
jgi:hypothetical protein